jgi:hypothetical protein
MLCFFLMLCGSNGMVTLGAFFTIIGCKKASNRFTLNIEFGVCVSGFWDRHVVLVYPCLFGRGYTTDAGAAGA